MVKEWMNVKRTKKDFRTRYDIDEEKVWVHLPDGKSEEEVEPLQLLVNEKNKDEFKEVAKKYIMNGLRDYAQTSPMIVWVIFVLFIKIVWAKPERLRRVSMNGWIII